MKNVVQTLTHIVQSVGLAVSPDDQVTLMVESISDAMEVDVCSLYLVNPQGEMVLLASHGLASGSVRKAKLPIGKGLVGAVATSGQAINIADANKHPAYFYLRETKEERFHGFCAVPLVTGGEVIGVLVVQRAEKRKFSESEEGFLLTLAGQLALMLANYPMPDSDTGLGNRVQGVKSAPGIAIGYSHLCDHGELYEVTNAPCDDIEGALIAWRQLLSQVRSQVEQEKSALGDKLGDNAAAIFSAYQMLLSDPLFTGEVEYRIQEGNWLPGALKQTIQHFAEWFLSMDDPYLKGRHEDIHYLGNKLFNAWRGAQKQPEQHDQAVVLVGHQVSISDIAMVPEGQLKGVVCFSGSALSHTAVLANALGIPAVMGTGPINEIVDDTLLVVDGNQGQVYINPNEPMLNEFHKLINENVELVRRLHELRDKEAITKDGQQVTLYTNTGLLADISPGLTNGAQGVGLYRTEMPFLIRESFPDEDEQYEVYQQVLQAYAGKPVYMRTLDIGGDKQLPYFPIGNEENPALGWRGIRFSLDNIELLKTQVRAMLRASADTNNLNVLLPMVSDIQEIEVFRKLLTAQVERLREEGISILSPRVGIMVEVPAIISLIPMLSELVDFISIGSNDLSQYLLALDRNNARVASRYDPVHPAVLLEIKRILENASAAGLPVSLCGEMASDPVAVVLLLGLGLRTLSMSAAKLLFIKRLVLSLSAVDASRLAEQAVRMQSAATIRAFIEQEISSLGLADLIR